MSYLESLALADRHFVAVPHLDHNGFIATGGLLRPLVLANIPDLPAATRDKLQRRRRGHEFVIEATRRFLDNALLGRDQQAWFDAVGDALPGARYRHDPPRWPRADRIALTRAVIERGLDAARALCARSEPCQKERRERFESVGDALTTAGLLAQAEAVYRANREDFPDQWRAWNEHARALVRVGRHDDARAAFLRARALIEQDTELPDHWRDWERESVDDHLGWLDEVSPPR